MATLDPIIVSSQDLVSLKIAHDILNVHPVILAVFRSPSEIYDLSLRQVRFSFRPDQNEDDIDSWGVMSYRTWTFPDDTGVQYSVLLYPSSVPQRLTSQATDIDGIRSRYPVTGSTTLAYPTTRGGAFASLAQAGVAVSINTEVQAARGWTVAYALMQAKIQAFRSLATDPDPSNWRAVAAKIPVLYATGKTLLSSTVRDLMSVATATKSSDVFPNQVDGQKVWQTNLTNYLLSGNEKTRTYANLMSAMWQKVFVYKTNVSPQFLGAYNLAPMLSRDRSSSDFYSAGANASIPANYLLFRAMFNSKEAPMFWTLYFGALT